MTITRASVTYITEDGSKPACRLTERDAGLNELLQLHITRLRGRAGKDGALPCHFLEPIGVNRGRLDQLAVGADDAFLEAASALALNIQQGMKGNSKGGLFVAISGREMKSGHDVTPFAAILKLEVVDPVAGYLREVQDGTRLATVKQLLVRPKELQKGAYYPDPRDDSEVLVGDTMDKAALYFLRGLGLTQEMASSDAVAFLARKIPEYFPMVREDDLLSRLERSTARVVGEFVSENLDLLGPLEAREALLADLAAQARPVRTINPAASVVLRREVVAGPFRLTFPPSARPQLTVRQREEDQRWETIVVTAEAPVFR